MPRFSDAQIYVDGVLRDAENNARYDDIGPWTGEVIARAPDASAKDMEEAIAAARRAFDGSDWSTNGTLRRSLVKRLCEKLRENRERLGDLSIIEGGAARGGVSFAHVDAPLSFFDKLFELYDALEWQREAGTVEMFGSRHRRLLVKEAAGVVGAITPWNVPFYITVGKVIPALLAGCTVILKPAPETPLIGLIVGELAHEAGFPRGVLNVVTGKDPSLLGEMLVTDKRVDVISFTGSTAVGRRIMEKGAPTLKRLFLELGGKSATIVLEDAPDFAAAVGRSIVCFHAGQGCATVTRLLVPRSRYREAIAVLEHAYAAYSRSWGSVEEPMNVMGPVISARQRDRIMGYIQSGLDEGARLIAGGQVARDKGPGFFVEPTCFVDVTNQMKIAREEIFGPVLAVIPFEDEEDAVRIANDSDYGLSGGVVSGDVEKAFRIARRIRTGSVAVNGGMCTGVDLPFGGYKQSGFGKEWGNEGFDEYLEQKVIAVALPA